MIMIGVEQQINIIKSKLLPGVELIAISKTKPIGLIKEAYGCGQRLFGENRVQELKQKYEELPKDIEWHFIGHLQSKQVKQIASFVSLIHSVDSLKLYSIINREAVKHNRVIDVLIQVKIAKEETKSGLSRDECFELLESISGGEFPGVRVVGVMGMSTKGLSDAETREEFINLSNIKQEIQENYFKNCNSFKEISMGMSGDYEIAMEVGSTMVRIGSTIFGQRK